MQLCTALHRKHLFWHRISVSRRTLSVATFYRCVGSEAVALVLGCLLTQAVWYGDSAVEAVQQGNEAIVKVTIMCIVAHHVELTFFVEQPISSLFSAVPFFANLLRETRARQMCVWLGAYGSRSAKPVSIFHNSTWGSRLVLPKPRGLAQLVRRRGRKVSGTPALAESAAYPPAFGQAFASLALEHLNVQSD